VLVASVVAMPALATGEAAPAVVPPTMYSVQFVAAAATGVAMNASGDVAGTSYIDTGCGPFCLPPQDTVVWRGVQRIVLPQVPGLTGIYVTGINAQGWVSGLAGFPGTATHAIVWKPTGNTYTAIDLGLLPGTTYSEAIGIDDTGRAVGWSAGTISLAARGSYGPSRRACSICPPRAFRSTLRRPSALEVPSRLWTHGIGWATRRASS